MWSHSTGNYIVLANELNWSAWLLTLRFLEVNVTKRMHHHLQSKLFIDSLTNYCIPCKSFVYKEFDACTTSASISISDLFDLHYYEIQHKNHLNNTEVNTLINNFRGIMQKNMSQYEYTKRNTQAAKENKSIIKWFLLATRNKE